MGSIPVVFVVDGEEIEVEANPDEKLLEAGSRVVPPEKWSESIITTASGLPVDINKQIREIIRETGQNTFTVLAEGDQGVDGSRRRVIPELPFNFLNVTVKSPRWRFRENEEKRRINMLNKLINLKNPGFGYINPRFNDFENAKVVKGWSKTNGFGTITFTIILPAKYPQTHPETVISGNFFEKYMQSELHKHVYPYRVNGVELLAICGNQKYLYNWNGRLGVAHYVAEFLFPWILLESKRLAEIEGISVKNPVLDILSLLRGD